MMKFTWSSIWDTVAIIMCLEILYRFFGLVEPPYTPLELIGTTAVTSFFIIGIAKVIKYPLFVLKSIPSKKN